MRTKNTVIAVLLASLIVAGGLFAGGQPEAAAGTGPIHVALSAPLTGDWSEFGIGFQRSVELAIEEINANGGVLGREFTLSVGDTRGNPQEAASLAQRWTSDPSIVAQIGPFASGSAMAAQPIFDAEGMVQLSPTASHADYAKGSPWSFGIVGTQAGEGPFNAQYAWDLGLRRMAVLHINNDWGIDATQYFTQAFEDLGGEVVATEFYFDGERDFTAALTKLSETTADGLYMASFYNDGAAINLQRDRLDWDVTVVGPTSLYASQLIELGGEAVEGLYTATGFFAEDPDAAVQTYVNAYRERYDAVPTFHMALAYDAMMLLADAIERAGSTDRAAIRDAIAETANFPGLAGTITFTPDGDANKGYRKLTIEDGRFVVVTN